MENAIQIKTTNNNGIRIFKYSEYIVRCKACKTSRPLLSTDIRNGRIDPEKCVCGKSNIFICWLNNKEKSIKIGVKTMGIIKNFFNKKVRKIESNKNSTMYNTEIFKAGLKNLLIDYKELLQGVEHTDKVKNKIKEIDFHINIINSCKE